MNRRSILSISAMTTIALATMTGNAIAQQKSLKEQLVGIWTAISGPRRSHMGLKIKKCESPDAARFSGRRARGVNDRSTDFLRGYAGPIALALTAALDAFMFRWTTQRSPADSSLAHKESAASRLFSPTRTRVQIGGAPGVSDVFTTIGL